MTIIIDLFVIKADLSVVRIGSKTFKTERGANLYLMDHGYRHTVGKEYAQKVQGEADEQNIAEVTFCFD